MENIMEQKNEIKQIAINQGQKWAQELLTKDAEVVADGFTKDATFLPTRSGELKRGQEGAKEYFEHFLESDPVCTFKSQHAFSSVDKQTIVHYGIYEFELNGENNSRTKVQGDFTFVLDNNNDWKKRHFHSSVAQNERQLSLLNEEIKFGEDFEQSFVQYFQDKTEESVEEIVVQFSDDKTIAIISILHSSELKNRSTIILSKVISNKWRIVRHHFSPKPE
jgi:uncharacterized protein (TIGR02246 family)